MCQKWSRFNKKRKNWTKGELKAGQKRTKSRPKKQTELFRYEIEGKISQIQTKKNGPKTRQKVRVFLKILFTTDWIWLRESFKFVKWVA